MTTYSDAVVQVLRYLCNNKLVAQPQNDEEIGSIAEELEIYRVVMVEGVSSRVSPARKILIDAARFRIYQSYFLHLSEEHVSRVDDILGLPPIDPRIGSPAWALKDFYI